MINTAESTCTVRLENKRNIAVPTEIYPRLLVTLHYSDTSKGQQNITPWSSWITWKGSVGQNPSHIGEVAAKELHTRWRISLLFPHFQGNSEVYMLGKNSSFLSFQYKSFCVKTYTTRTSYEIFARWKEMGRNVVLNDSRRICWNGSVWRWCRVWEMLWRGNSNAYIASRHKTDACQSL